MKIEDDYDLIFKHRSHMEEQGENPIVGLTDQKWDPHCESYGVGRSQRHIELKKVDPNLPLFKMCGRVWPIDSILACAPHTKRAPTLFNALAGPSRGWVHG